MQTLTVHLRVNDADTGKPTPVRLSIRDEKNRFFMPFGHPDRIPMGRGEAVGGGLRVGNVQSAFIDGTCEIRLPTRVPLHVEIIKGPEYTPIRETVTLGAGQMTLRFTIQRWANWAEQGWHSGDTRCHFLTPHDALLEGQAEDVAVTNLLSTVDYAPSFDGHLYPRIANIHAFSGQQPILEQDGYLVVVNTFNTHPALGKLGLLSCHRPVYPLSFGDEEGDDWSLADWADQCHRKKGLVVWGDAFRADSGLMGGEALINLILGRVDALEYDAVPRTQPLLPHWYRLLNAGFRVPIVGGSGKDRNSIALGAMRTYAKIASDEPLTYRTWIEALREGKTFVTNGPLMNFEIIDRNRLSAYAQSLVPFDVLEIVHNGKVIAEGKPNGADNTVTLELDNLSPLQGWIAARCRGTENSMLQPDTKIFSHTSPLYLGELKPDQQSCESLRTMVAKTREWVENQGRYEEARFRDLHLRLCDEAMARLTSVN